MTLGEVHFPGAPRTPGDGDGVGGRGRSGDAAGALGGTPFSLGAIFRVPAARRGAGVGAFLLAIVTAGALAHVGVRLKGLEVAYDLGRERRIDTEMEEQRRRLQIEIGMLKDPRRVIAIARDKLNMGPPAPEAIWRLGSGRPGSSLSLSFLNGVSATPGATVKAVAQVSARSGRRKVSDGTGRSAAGANSATAVEIAAP